jgi:HEPN domain-containing protein
MINEENEYLKNWLFRANEDIAVINNLFKTDQKLYARTICLHAQQAVEKFLKAFLVFNNVDFPRTHDVDYLLLECQKIDKEGFDIDLVNLSDFGVSLRYPDDFYVPDKEETILYRDIAIKVKYLIDSRIRI